MIEMLLVAGITVAALLVGAGLLHTVPRLGRPGRAVSAAMCRAPMLDAFVGYFTVAPLVAGGIVAGWEGLAGGLLGQMAALLIWTGLHGWSHPAAYRGPRVVKLINRLVGPWRNYAATWVTATVVPLFWLIRMAQVLVYPFLVWLVRFPRYRHGEWISVSRQKFEGLVGHDLIWCLYCDWMTGVWSLGSEMLRNVESFWCPIRFRSDKKCENCRHEFPDMATDWIPVDGTMADVVGLLESKYDGRVNAWFGHPVRLTVDGEKIRADDVVPRHPMHVPGDSM